MKVKSPLDFAGGTGVFKKRAQADALGKDMLLQKYLHTTRGNQDQQEREHQIYAQGSLRHVRCHGRGWTGLTLFMLLLIALTICSFTVVIGIPYLSNGSEEKSLHKENVKLKINSSNYDKQIQTKEHISINKLSDSDSKFYQDLKGSTKIEDDPKSNDIHTILENHNNTKDNDKMFRDEDMSSIASRGPSSGVNLEKESALPNTNSWFTNITRSHTNIEATRPKLHTGTSLRFNDINGYYANETASIAIYEPFSKTNLARNVISWKYKNINPRASMFSSIDLLLPKTTKNLTLALSNRDKSLKFYALIYKDEADIAEYVSDTGDLIIKHSRIPVVKYQDSIVVEAKPILVKWLEEAYQLSIITYGSSSNESPVIVIKYKQTIRRKSLSFMGLDLTLKRMKPTNDTEVKSASGNRDKRWINFSENYGCCQLSSWKIHVNDLGLDVVFPNEISINYCTGNCRLMDDNAKFSLNALLRAKFRILNKPGQVPEPQCIATKYHTLHFLVQHENELLLHQLPELLITECGCR